MELHKILISGAWLLRRPSLLSIRETVESPILTAELFALVATLNHVRGNSHAEIQSSPDRTQMAVFLGVESDVFVPPSYRPTKNSMHWICFPIQAVMAACGASGGLHRDRHCQSILPHAGI